MSLLTRCTVRLGPSMCKRQATDRLVYECKQPIENRHRSSLQLCDRHAGQHRAGEIFCRTCREHGKPDVPMELVVDEPFTV